MADLNLDGMTLRELFKLASSVTRELAEHLQQGFLPQVQELARMVRPKEASGVYRLDDEAITDVTVRNQVATVLERENFTEELSEKLALILQAIDEEVARVLDS